MGIVFSINTLKGKQVTITSSCLGLRQHMPCFASLNPEVMERLIGSMKEQYFAKAEIILLEGEPCPGLFVVESGSVKLYRSSPEGEELIVRIVRPGGCFECVPLFDGRINPVSAQALGAGKVYLLPALDFESLLSTYPQAGLTFAKVLAGRLRSLFDTVGDYSFLGTYARLARLIDQLAEQEDGRLVVSRSLPLYQHHFACMLGRSRQVVNGCLRKLVDDNIIRMEGRQIVVLDPEALRRIS